MRVGVCLVVAVLCAGCAAKKIEFGPQGQIQDPAALLTSVEAMARTVDSVQGEGRLSVDSPQGRGALSAFFAAARPANLHFETLNFFGKPTSVLVTRPDAFGLYQAEPGEYLRGPPSAQNLSLFLPIVIKPDELIRLMLADPPRMTDAEKMSLDIDETARAYRLTLERGSLRQTLWIDPKYHRIVRSRWAGVATYEFESEDVETVSGQIFPRRVGVKTPQGSLELSYKDVTLNAPVDPALFGDEIPPGVKVIELDEFGRQR